MRTSMKIARGVWGAVDPRVAAYQEILAMADWTLFAPLDFRRWAGSTIAYRDAERSEAVEGDGDPLGLVDPLVGEPLVQEVSAERPVWTERGAYHGGQGALLATADGDWDITGDESFTAVIVVEIHTGNQGSNQSILAKRSGVSGEGSWRFAILSNDNTGVQIDDGETTVNQFSGRSFYNGRTLMALRVDREVGDLTFFADGQIRSGSADISTVGSLENSGPLTTNGAFGQFCEHTLEAVMIAPGVLSVETLSDIEDLLL